MSVYDGVFCCTSCFCKRRVLPGYCLFWCIEPHASPGTFHLSALLSPGVLLFVLSLHCHLRYPGLAGISKHTRK